MPMSKYYVVLYDSKNIYFPVKARYSPYNNQLAFCGGYPQFFGGRSDSDEGVVDALVRETSEESINTYTLTDGSLPLIYEGNVGGEDRPVHGGVLLLSRLREIDDLSMARIPGGLAELSAQMSRDVLHCERTYQRLHGGAQHAAGPALSGRRRLTTEPAATRERTAAIRYCDGAGPGPTTNAGCRFYRAARRAELGCRGISQFGKLDRIRGVPDRMEREIPAGAAKLNRIAGATPPCTSPRHRHRRVLVSWPR